MNAKEQDVDGPLPVVAGDSMRLKQDAAACRKRITALEDAIRDAQDKLDGERAELASLARWDMSKWPGGRGVNGGQKS
jgi:hypothetical protein